MYLVGMGETVLAETGDWLVPHLNGEPYEPLFNGGNDPLPFAGLLESYSAKPRQAGAKTVYLRRAVDVSSLPTLTLGSRPPCRRQDSYSAIAL